MADNQNPTQGQMIDLRALPGGSAGSAATTGAGATTSSSGAAQAATGGDKKSLFEKFEIPETVRQKYADLIPLILETESMSDEERQYWFQIMPIMTDDQIVKLREILVNEKQQLKKIDQDYQQEMKQINSKHVSEWKEFEAKEKREKLRAAEKTAEQQEKTEEEQLLGKLNEV